MDAEQIRQLKPMLTRYLRQFDDCFTRRRDAGPFLDLRRRAVVRPRREELRADRRGGRDSAAELAGVPVHLQVGRRPHSKPLAGNRDPGPRGPQFGRHHRRNQRREARGQDPRRQAAVVRHGRQDRELHRHRASGLRRRRFPLPVGRRLVSARGLVGRPRPLPRGGHSRRGGVSAEVENRAWSFSTVPAATA